MSLTGKTRFRIKRRFLRSSLIVLEVEERVHRFDRHNGGAWSTRWRDAREGDVSLSCKLKVTADPPQGLGKPPTTPPPHRDGDYSPPARPQR